MECIVAKKYHLGRKIGKGAFGDIYMGTDEMTNSHVAIKIEAIETSSQQLAYEAKAYQYVREGIGFPHIYYFGREGKYNILVMDLLGPSLEDLFRFCRCQFSLKTVCMLAQEMIQRIEYIHSQNLLHRDIKPDNFVIGMNKHSNVVHLIDLGLCKRYIVPSTSEHIPYRENKNLTGTPRYASIANHLSLEQSRRDDLEALGYVLIYFMKGNLPWQGLRGENKKEKYKRILEAKLRIRMEDLCVGLPVAFLDYMDYCRGLRFTDSPDYAYLRGLFATALEEAGLVNDGVYDWMVNRREGEGEGKSVEIERDWKYIPFYCKDEMKGDLIICLRSPNPNKELYVQCLTWPGKWCGFVALFWCGKTKVFCNEFSAGITKIPQGFE